MPADLCEHMTKLRVLVVDDEPPARERVCMFLRAYPAVEVSGVCSSSAEALAAIRTDRRDIAFVDVKMPGSNGLQWLDDLPALERPAVIIATAYDSFAVEAFAAQVVDYIMKPFDQERFGVALHRAIEHVQMQQKGDLMGRIESMLVSSQQPKHDRLVVKVDGRRIFLRADEIIWVEAANNYAILHLVDGKRLVLREKISSVEKQLDDVSFARINRSAIVQIDQIHELQPNKSGDYTVVLRNGARMPLSRHLRGQFAALAAGELKDNRIGSPDISVI